MQTLHYESPSPKHPRKARPVVRLIATLLAIFGSAAACGIVFGVIMERRVVLLLGLVAVLVTTVCCWKIALTGRLGIKNLDRDI